MISEEEYIEALKVVKEYGDQHGLSVNVEVIPECHCEPIELEVKTRIGKKFAAPYCWGCNAFRKVTWI